MLWRSSLAVRVGRFLHQNNFCTAASDVSKSTSWLQDGSLPKELLTFSGLLRHRANCRRKLIGLPHAAVLVPFCLVQGQLSLLFTWRSLLVGSHKNQASLRETQEEIGILPENVITLGLFDDYRSINGYCVTPVIGFIGDIGRHKLKVNEREVQQVFMLSLAHLLNESNMRIENTSRGTMPIYSGGPVEIWGLTACILRDILKIFPFEK